MSALCAKTRGFRANPLAINRQPNGEAWSIFDANWETDLVDGLPYGGGMFWDSFRPYGSDLSLAPEYFKTQIPTYIESGMAYQADTLDELAEKIGCDAETFKATVERYNGMCEAGKIRTSLQKARVPDAGQRRPVLCAQGRSRTACGYGRPEDQRRFPVP